MDRIIVDQILDEIDYEFARKEPPESFPNLKRIPAERYLDQALFEEELNLFKNSWQFVGTVHEFPEVGSYKVMDRWGGASVVVVKGEDGHIRSFWNVCQHRGGPVVEGAGGYAEEPKYEMPYSLLGLRSGRQAEGGYQVGGISITNLMSIHRVFGASSVRSGKGLYSSIWIQMRLHSRNGWVLFMMR